MSKGQSKKVKAIEELTQKLRVQERKRAEKIEMEEKNRKRLPIDYQYYSTEDEADLSDYEVNEKELYPQSPKK